MKRPKEPNPFVKEKLPWWRRLGITVQSPRLPVHLLPSERALAFAVILSLIITFSQGLDYIARPVETAPTLSILEQKVPLDFWGTIFITFAGIALIGGLFSLWPAGILGHGVLAFTYFAIGSGVIWSVVEDWKGYGWNTGVVYLCFGVFHYLIADGCYDEWAREWKKAPPPVELGMVEDESGELES